MKNKRFAILLLLTLFLTGCSIISNPSKTPSPTQDFSNAPSYSEAAALQEQARFDAFTDSVFKEELSQNILNLHSTLAHPEDYGINSYTISFGDLSLPAHEQAYETLTSYQTTLSTFDTSLLTPSQQFTWSIFNTYCQDSLKFKNYRLYPNYLSPDNGMHIYLPTLLTNYSFYDEQDIQDYLSALQHIPAFFQQLLDYAKEQTAAGTFMTDEQIDASISACHQFLTNPDTHYLLDSFHQRLQSPNLNIKDTSKLSSYEDKNADILKNSVFPAYENLASELNALKGTSKNQHGLAYLENGKEYYSLLVREATGSSKSVPQIQTMLQKQLDSDFQELLKLGFEHPEALDKMELCTIDTDNPVTVLNHLKEAIKKDFPIKENPEFYINYVPATMEDCTNPAYYILPPLDIPNQNHIYINRGCLTTTIEDFVTLAHEGFPGHLYQTTYFYSTNPSLIRKLFSYNGYSEGWGTYAELYSYQLSGADEITARLNQLNKTYSLALYCLGDIGIHYDGWTKEDTINYYKKIGLPPEDATAIYNALLNNPAVYLSYYVGYLEIMELKALTINHLGDNFNLKEFHQCLLEIGPAPFELIHEELFNRLITTTNHPLS